MTMKERLAKTADESKKAAVRVGESLSGACDVAKASARTIAVAIFDQDGDGLVTKEDVCLLSKKGADTGKKVVKRTVEILDEASKTDLVKEAAAGALVGAAVAVPVPLVGPVAGAAIGASIGVYANITRGNQSQGKLTSKTVKKAGAAIKRVVSTSKERREKKGGL